jgi:hypothetical protein
MSKMKTKNHVLSESLSKTLNKDILKRQNYENRAIVKGPNYRPKTSIKRKLKARAANQDLIRDQLINIEDGLVEPSIRNFKN